MDLQTPTWLPTAGWLHDGDISRELVAAVVAVVVFLLTAPAGRRRLAAAAIVILLFAPVPLALPLLFPEEATAGWIAELAVRFLVLASLLQSLLLVAAVSVWERIGRPLEKIFLDVFRWLAAAVALLVILLEAGVDPAGVFAGSALISAAIGFASKDTLGNLFAGLAIHAEHPFEVGDWIQYDADPAHVGEVVEINWRATKVITLDLAHVIVPNGQLAQASIRNFTKPDPWSRRSLFVVTPYSVSPQRVQRIILEAIRGSFGVLEQPAPSVVTNAFTERGVEHWVRLFTTEFDKRDKVDGMARDRIWFALARHGIEIPVATQSIRLTPLPPPVEEDPLPHRLAAISRVDLFAPLGPERLRRLAAAAGEVTFAAGEPVIRQGEAGSSLYLVDSGRVAVSVRAADGGERPVGELGPGEFFGEMSLLTGSPRSASVSAIEESRLIEISADTLREFLAEAPSLAEDLGELLACRERSLRLVLADEPPRQVGKADLLSRIIEFFSLEAFGPTPRPPAAGSPAETS
jgi:small-conductance mechanosensitive channel/CRP-like cAMP-binding protein